jgi:hypothetical protein
MSNNSVRDALEASVTWRRPPVSRAMRYESTVPAASEPSARPAQMAGSSPASQVILVAVKYGSSRSPVSSVTRASCPASRSASQIRAVRPVPDHRRLPLVGDADAGDAGRPVQGLAARGQGGLPDLLGDVLDPAGPRVVLRELGVAAGGDGAVRRDHQGGDARRAGIDGEDTHGD